nr:MAG TPA: hypothetical protein [Inoviridae sp.]
MFCYICNKKTLYIVVVYIKGFFKKNVAKTRLWGCLGITMDDGRWTRDKNDLWKAWKSGKLKFTTLPPFPQATTKRNDLFLKKNIHFLFLRGTKDEGRGTKDEGRRTKDEGRTAPSRVFVVANDTHKAHTEIKNMILLY